ncbi:hypothetical protein F3J37_01030 [Pantoea sp. Al-1710]|uniref:Uncharacterized protein n=1 Tax=Candidatus Pantoea communis TaxID=2608354 RepID=A0ABX0RMY9_9GAMM|nr:MULTISPECIES: hypothetical protein [Pantoea]NIG13040.1 hypothetical protein [Pantoea sp. Cy-640]NIG17259.1 hypothetical protein [Pantoea communis]
MSDFGFQGFNASAGLQFDTSVMFSRLKGSFQIPISQYTFQAPYSVSFAADFSGGTPFTFFVPIAGITVPNTETFAYLTPNITIGSGSITLSYNNNIASFPDDLATGLWIGGLMVYWGVYYGPHDL